MSIENICKHVVNHVVTVYLEADEPPTKQEVAKQVIETYQAFMTLHKMKSDDHEAEKRYILNKVTQTISTKGSEAKPIVSETLRKKKTWYKPSDIPDDGTGYWEDYKLRVENSEKLGPKVAKSADRDTDRIIQWFGNPKGEEGFNRKGVVMGNVQSGKTLNMTGLIAKAIDVGYRDIIVFAGAWNSLQTQTQKRMEEDLIGYTYNKDGMGISKVGVGKSKKRVLLKKRCHLLTQRGEDFTERTSRGVGAVYHPKETTRFFVVKKDWRILERLYEYLSKENAFEERSALILDDECDHYSTDANARKKGEDASKTNRLVRMIVNKENGYKRSTYVGYSATPFANFLAAREGAEDIGASLFPEDFIIPIEPPSNYVGYKQLFGDGEEEVGDETYKLYNDIHLWIPPGIPKDYLIQEQFFPQSLKDALDAFLLGVAAKWIRERQSKTVSIVISEGGYEPTSMLIHTSTLKGLHFQIREQIQNYLEPLRASLRGKRDDENDADWVRLRKRWENDFTPKTIALNKKGYLKQASEMSWPEIKRHLLELLDVKHSICYDVSNSDERLSPDWDSYRGKARILIGGATLSRGLTIEGLITSYFYKPTKKPNMDTLTQMSRWFGYREGYRDLCRLYGQKKTIVNFTDLSYYEQQAREELNIYAEEEKTPREVAIRLRTHPGMNITGLNKVGRHVRRSVEKVNYFGRPYYVYDYSAKGQDVKDNFSGFIRLINSIDPSSETGKGFKYPVELSKIKLRNKYVFYKGVPKQKISEFLEKFKSPVDSLKQPKDIVKSLKKTKFANDWTVMVANLTENYEKFPCELPFDLRPVNRGSKLDDINSINAEEEFHINQITEGTGGDRVADVICDLFSSGSAAEEVKERYQNLLTKAQENKDEKLLNEDGTVKLKLLQECRGKNSGLILLYPFWAKDKNDKKIQSKFPFIGVAVMIGNVPDWKSSSGEHLVNDPKTEINNGGGEGE